MTEPTSDVEIVRRCAAVMGIHLADGVGLHDHWAHKIWPDPHDNGGLYKYWPLTDKSQAFELVERLHLTISYSQLRDFWSVRHFSGGRQDANETANSLLRAICLCACKIAKE